MGSPEGFLQVIKVSSSTWVDSTGQLCQKRTVRQMKKLTRGRHNEFTEFVHDESDGGFRFGAIDFNNVPDGTYELVCRYHDDGFWGNHESADYSLRHFAKKGEKQLDLFTGVELK